MDTDIKNCIKIEDEDTEVILINKSNNISMRESIFRGIYLLEKFG